MSSTQVSNNIINAKIDDLTAKIDSLLAEVASLRTQAKAAPTSSSSAPEKPVTERKKRKANPNAATAPWIVFTGRVRELLRNNGYEKGQLGKECQMFCGNLKDENKDLATWTDEDILARRAAWTAPTTSKQAAAGIHYKDGKKVVTPPGSAANSVVDGEANVGATSSNATSTKKRKNPWEGLTEEQRKAKSAAMKAGKEAKKAATTTTEDSANTTSSTITPVAQDTAPVLMATSSSSVSNAAAVAATTEPAADSNEFKGVMVGGTRYLVQLSSGHCYKREKDGSQGDWAGIFHRTGGPKGGPWIDDKVPEPVQDDDEDNADGEGENGCIWED